MSGGEAEEEDDLAHDAAMLRSSNQRSRTTRRATRETGDTLARCGEDGGHGYVTATAMEALGRGRI